MKKDIILAGVGGQGILSIAATIGLTALNMGMNIKQSEVHGMSQRGGDVMSNLRLSDQEIFSDLIPEGKADMIIALEPMEAMRYLPMLAKGGWIISNSTPFKNIANYPDENVVISELKKQPNTIIIDGDNIAKELGSAQSANMIVLGAAATQLGFPFQEIEKAIRQMFGKKGEDVVNLNINALKTGFEAAGK
jgi:indolepyruvate ferredoxin oxidoreductase, beta subunit